MHDHFLVLRACPDARLVQIRHLHQWFGRGGLRNHLISDLLLYDHKNKKENCCIWMLLGYFYVLDGADLHLETGKYWRWGYRVEYRRVGTYLYLQVCYFRIVYVLLCVLQWTLSNSGQSAGHWLSVTNGRNYGDSRSSNHRFLYFKWIPDYDSLRHSIRPERTILEQITLDLLSSPPRLNKGAAWHADWSLNSKWLSNILW